MILDTERAIRDIQDRMTVRASETSGGSGTSFPTGISTGFEFFRTDLLLACAYDGARWLTTSQYTATLGVTSVTANGASPFSPIRQDYAPYVNHYTIEYIVQTTNNGTNFWTIDLRGVSADYSATSTIHTFNTSAATVNVYTSLDVLPTTTVTPTNRAFLDINVTKTLTPGTLTFWVTAYYHLIIT